MSNAFAEENGGKGVQQNIKSVDIWFLEVLLYFM